MADFDTIINGAPFSFKRHLHMGIAYYNITNSNGQTTMVQSHGTWTFLHPEEVPKELSVLKSELVAAIEANEHR